MESVLPNLLWSSSWSFAIFQYPVHSCGSGLAAERLQQRFSTFVTLWTPQKFQARVADPTAQGFNLSYSWLGQNMCY